MNFDMFFYYSSAILPLILLFYFFADVCTYMEYNV